MKAPSEPELAVVVLAVGEMPHIPAAIESLLAQPEPLEIVLVHSGARERDLEYTPPPGVRRVSSEDLLLTGAARNLGVAQTRAPWVAFLSGDCRALPGWATRRLAAHRDGAPVVAAALVNPSPESAIAWASYILLHHRRWPGVPSHLALHYGASYSRQALLSVNGFDPRLAVGEDTDLNRRLAGAGVASLWEPRIQATHPYATEPIPFRREHAERGARAARAWLTMNEPAWARELGARPLRRAARALAFSWRYAAPTDRHRLLKAFPWVIAGGRDYARGARSETSRS